MESSFLAFPPPPGVRKPPPTSPFSSHAPPPLPAGGLGTSTPATVGCSTCWRRGITRTTATLGPLTPKCSLCVASVTCSGTREVPSTPPARAPTSRSPGARPTTPGPPDTRVNKVWLATCLLWIFYLWCAWGTCVCMCTCVCVQEGGEGEGQLAGIWAAVCNKAPWNPTSPPLHSCVTLNTLVISLSLYLIYHSTALHVASMVDLLGLTQHDPEQLFSGWVTGSWSTYCHSYCSVITIEQGSGLLVCFVSPGGFKSLLCLPYLGRSLSHMSAGVQVHCFPLCHWVGLVSCVAFESTARRSQPRRREAVKTSFTGLTPGDLLELSCSHEE